MKPDRKSETETRRSKTRTAAVLFAIVSSLVIFAVCSGMILGNGIKKYISMSGIVTTRSSSGASLAAFAAEPSPAVVNLVRYGGAEAAYNAGENNFKFAATVKFNSNYTFNYNFKWYYKLHGSGEYILVHNTDDNSNEFYFGKGISVGDYDVKVELTVNYYIDGTAHPMTPVTDEIESACRIVKGSLSLDNLPAPSITYGQGVDKITLFDKLNRGQWSFDKNLIKRVGGATDWVAVESLFDSNGVLPVGKYLLKGAVSPYNQNNYDATDNIALTLSVEPKEVKVYIEDVETVEGKPLVSSSNFVSYLVLNGEKVDENVMLVGADTFASLGVTLVKAEGNTFGEYTIDGEWNNVNYNVTFVGKASPDSDFNVGGTYTIRPNKLSVLINNMLRVTVTDMENGFPLGSTLTYAAEEGGLPSASVPLTLLGRYRFNVILNDGIVRLKKDVSITVDKLVLAANYVLFAPSDADTVWTQKKIENGKSTFVLSAPSEGFSLCFASVYIQPGQDMLWLDFTLAVFDSLLMLILYMIFLQLYAKRRDALK